MFRYLIAHLPSFRLERCGWSDALPAVLVAEEKSALRVQAATSTARHQGIRPGMTLSEARARLPELGVEHLDPEGEAQDLEAVTAQLLRISPGVAALPPDTLVADISRVAGRGGPGEGRTAGAERALVERVRIRLSHLGHRVCVVVADDPITARAVAIWEGRSRVLPPGEGPAALAPLPLPALELPPREQLLLEGLGLETVGAFAALPASAVVGRLGPLAVAAHALARGHTATAPLPSTDDVHPLHALTELPDPVVDHAALRFVLNAQLIDLCARLAARGEAATHLRLHLGLDTVAEGASSEQELSVRLGEPGREPRRILDLLGLRLERIQLAGPVVAVGLEVAGTTPWTGRQRDLMGQDRRDEALAQVGARLQDTLGSHALILPQPTHSHRPEAEWRPPAQPVDHTGQLGLFARPEARSEGTAALEDDPAWIWAGRPAQVARDRPPLLQPEPEAVGVHLRVDGSPEALDHAGRWHGISAAWGPERLAGEWWSSLFQRSYWRVALQDGRRAWLYQEDGRWYLHGWWDR